jgi:autotransporter-associated beta strand protein
MKTKTKPPLTFAPARWLALITILFTLCASVRAQEVIATWNSGGGDGDWNNATNWDQLLVPGPGTNASIVTAALITYSTPMAAPSFDDLYMNAGIITNNINASGFNVVSNTIIGTNVTVVINSGGVMTNALMIIRAKGTNIINGGILTNGITQLAYDNNNDGGPLRIYSGSVVNLGNVGLYRSGNSTWGSGLTILGGSVYANSITNGMGNSYCQISVGGGTLTNYGDLIMARGATASRAANFYQTNGIVSCGGLVVMGAGSNVVAGFGAGNPAALFIASGVAFFTNYSPATLFLTNAIANFTNGGTIYLGADGFQVRPDIISVNPGNTAVSATNKYNVRLSDGGTFGASADWAGNADMNLTGGNFTFKAAGLDGTAHNIAFSGHLSGAGALTKAGNGTLTLQNTNTYSGGTFVNQGILAMGATGVVSGPIMVAAGATFDASGVTGGFLLQANQAIGGVGTVIGPVTALSGSFIRPASNTVPGVITFNGTLTESNAINNFDISTNPNGVNDMVTVNGDLVLLGTNTLQVNPLGLLTGGNTYTLFQYTGNLTGNTNNFSVAGANAYISIDTTAKTVSLVVTGGGPVPSDVVWRGGITGNAWDTLISSNWFYTGTGTRDVFVVGDRATFDDTGATNPVVTISGSVSPASLVVNSTSNYTFAGTGSIDGITGLTKTNSGKLTILTTNNFTGPVVIGGGTVEVGTLAPANTACSLGADGSDPANLLLIDTTLRYLGGNVTIDRGATVNDLGATFDVTNSGTTLTVNGPVQGAGSVTKVGPGTLTLGAGVNSYAGTTTVSNGTLRFNSVTGISTNTINLAGGTLYPSVGSASATFANPVNVFANSGWNVGGGNHVVQGPWSGAATLNVAVSTNGYFTFNADFSSFTGTVAMGTNDGSLRFNAGGNSTGAQQCTGNSNVLFDLGTGFGLLYNRNGGGTYGVYYLGALAGSGPNTQVRGSANAGSTCTYVIGGKGLNTTYAGTIENGFASSSGTSPQASAAVTVFKTGTGTLTLSGANIYTGTTLVSNGVLALTGSGSIAKSPIIDILTNAALDSSARTDGTLTVNSNQTLTGEGTVRGSVTVANGATLSPGENEGATPWGSGYMGTLTINNALVLQAGSTTVMDIDRSANLNDQVTGMTSVTYGGTLDVSHIYDDTYIMGDKYKLFSAQSYHGSFANIVPAMPNTGNPATGWDLSYLAIDGTLRVGVLRPWIGNYQVSGGSIIINGLAGEPNSPFDLLSSTNVALPISQWTTNQSGFIQGDGTFSVTNAVDPSKPQEFFRIQMLVQ